MYGFGTGTIAGTEKDAASCLTERAKSVRITVSDEDWLPSTAVIGRLCNQAPL